MYKGIFVEAEILPAVVVNSLRYPGVLVKQIKRRENIGILDRHAMKGEPPMRNRCADPTSMATSVKV